MKSKKISFLFICFTIFINPTFSQSGKQLLDDVVLPIANGVVPFLGIPPPAGPILCVSLGLMQLFSSKLGSLNPSTAKNQTKAEPPLSRVDLMELRSAILSQIKNLDDHLVEESERIIRELTMTIESNGLFEDMRLTLDYFQQMFNYRMKAIINPKITGTQKQLTIQDMINYGSDFRYKLNGFIDKFIKPNVNGLHLLKPIKLFFDLLLEKEQYLASKHDDYTSDSLHNKIYKSFVYIIKVLTDAYLMVASAHVVKYQELLHSQEYLESDELRDNTMLVIDEYKEDAKILIKTTQLALERASREIKNSGKFELIKGKTYEHISFSQIIPKIQFFEYIDVFYYKCKKEKGFVDIDDFEIDLKDCSNREEDIPFGSEIVFGVDFQTFNKDSNPYNFLKVKMPNGTQEFYGHEKRFMNILYPVKQHAQCHTVFCPAYRKQYYGISLQRVSAKPGNVITGVRFRVEDRIIYIDIQQGKYQDLISVDPETVFWTESPKSDRVAYLSEKTRAFELGDFELKRNSILTSIQFQTTSLRNGMIRLLTNGLTPPYMNNTDSVYSDSIELEMFELNLENADSPLDKQYANAKNYASRPPVPGKRYLFSFQPTNMKKDMGHTTIPLLDVREVITDPPAPLNGLGLYHESVEGSGGLLALKLITPKLTDLLYDMNNE